MPAEKNRMHMWKNTQENEAKRAVFCLASPNPRNDELELENLEYHGKQEEASVHAQEASTYTMLLLPKSVVSITSEHDGKTE